MSERTTQAFELARQQYADLEVDVDQAMATLAQVSLSIHCWQADDVGGFEKPQASLSGGGIQVTGNFPGKPRNLDEMRADLKTAFSLIPGQHRLSLHAIYGDFGGKLVDRDAIAPEHFQSWIDWAREQAVALDFNATCFSHAKASDGLTLSHRDAEIRRFWIDHVKRCREIAAAFGASQGRPAMHNLWIPDGTKDLPVNRMGYRQNLLHSLDSIYAHEFPQQHLRDAVESKVFGIGAESFTVGSHEFYLGYALSRNKMICLDLGHFHPTESIADKLSAIYQFQDELLLHVSRPVRWDSDHVVIFNDDVRHLGEELVRCGKLSKAWIGLDFFDATINRVGAYAIGARAMLKSLLVALLEPHAQLLAHEAAGDNFSRLATLEQLKSMPFGAVWDYYCARQQAPNESQYIEQAKAYQSQIVSRRS